MTRFMKVLILLQLPVAFCCAQSAHNPLSTSQTFANSSGGTTQTAAWTSPKIQHAYGLPEAKPKEKGTLTVDAEGLTLTGKSSRYTIPGPGIIAVSTGSERVEMWGTTGRIVRMAIPDAGGLTAAGVMHHKVNELTVEFHDTRGAYHGAVFYLPGKNAARILESYSATSQSHSDTATPLSAVVSETECRNFFSGTSRKTGAVSSTPPEEIVSSPLPGGAHPSSLRSGIPYNVLVAAPDWNQAEVPAAYRALVYEHIVDRLRRVDGIGHVYREGEIDYRHACPQYTVSISIVNFKPGNQVERATMGPIGFFAGTTQMTFNANITDAGGLNITEHVKATVRGESESKNVADGVAKKLAKRYAAALKQYEKTKARAGA
jgi:hypothetical protein